MLHKLSKGVKVYGVGWLFGRGLSGKLVTIFKRKLKKTKNKTESKSDMYRNKLISRRGDFRYYLYIFLLALYTDLCHIQASDV